MGRLLLRLLISALALWLTTLIMNPHLTIKSFDENPSNVFAYIVGIVNGVVGGIIRVVAFPLYVITLGLISLVVNALLLLLVAWISSLIGFGLSVENFGWGVLGAIVIGVISWLIGIILRPFTRSGVERR
jgi:putative membrane protein